MNLLTFVNHEDCRRYRLPLLCMNKLPPSSLASLRRCCKKMKRYIDEHSDFFQIDNLKVTCIGETLFTNVYLLRRKFINYRPRKKENKLGQFRMLYKNQYIVKLKIKNTELNAMFLTQIIDELHHSNNNLIEGRKVLTLKIENCVLGNDINDSQLFCQFIECCQPDMIDILNVPNLGRIITDIATMAIKIKCTYVTFMRIGSIRLNYTHALHTYITKGPIRSFGLNGSSRQPHPSVALLSVLGCKEICDKNHEEDPLNQQEIYIDAEDLDYTIRCQKPDGSCNLMTRDDVENAGTSSDIG